MENIFFELEKLQFDAAKPAKSHTILTLRNAKSRRPEIISLYNAYVSPGKSGRKSREIPLKINVRWRAGLCQFGAISRVAGGSKG